MKYACLVYHDGKTLALPAEERAGKVGDCRGWLSDLKGAGQHVYSAGLEPANAATTVRNRDHDVSVMDGPFAETKEVLAGFTIIEARDLNEAIRHATRLAACSRSTIEVRPLLDMESN